MPQSWYKRGRRTLLATFLLSVAGNAQAKIDLVTLPTRGETQLTIYNSQDLTLARERRPMMLKQGRNEVQFSWANTTIDPSSLKLELIEKPAGYALLDAHYPAYTTDMIIWTIEAPRDGAVEVEISYFVSGVSWRADYSALANADETMLRLEPNFTLTNNSGEEFERAKTRLVVGDVNLVESITGLAWSFFVTERRDQKKDHLNYFYAKNEGMDEDIISDAPIDPFSSGGAFADAFAASSPFQEGMEKAKEIIKASVSEYQLYTVEGTETIPDGWSKQLPNPRIDEIPIEVSYEYNPAEHGSSVVKFYKFKNDSEHQLGEVQLPEGTYYVYSDDARDGVCFEASYEHQYVPVGEDVELNLQSDGRVILEQRTMNEHRDHFEYDNQGNVIGFDIINDVELEIRNSNERNIPIKITLPMNQNDWEIVQCTDDFKKVDARTAEWEIRVEGLNKKVIRYTLVTRTGSRNRTKS